MTGLLIVLACIAYAAFIGYLCGRDLVASEEFYPVVRILWSDDETPWRCEIVRNDEELSAPSTHEHGALLQRNGLWFGHGPPPEAALESARQMLKE